ncbi:MAG: methionine--tRNA ligase [Candidatus Hermodarchaeia archaeon]|jgi:methionyl-tRNA synthetase
MTLTKSDKILVTCGLPYSNGTAHIGHLRTYIPGDAYVRYLKRFGFDVRFVCGSDTHGAPIELAAEEAGITPQKLVEKYHAHFKNIFETLNIGVDFYGTTEAPYHYKRAQTIIRTLEENGYVEAREVELPYCNTCKTFLADRFLVGTCPYCGALARGDECDQGCQRYLDADQLIDPRCVICGSPAVKRKTRHHFLKLPAFTDFLINFNEQLKGTPLARNYALGWIRQGLKDWGISRDLKWGIPYPGDEKLVLYVWAENYAGYISFTEEWARQTGADWKDYWIHDGKLVNFIGADIVYHHAVFWPAILKGVNYNTPYAIVASGMVKVEGHGLSKSRGFVIDIEEDFIKQGIDLDSVRYYILSYTGHTKDLDFVWKDFQSKLNNELVGILGNYAYRVLLFIHKNFKKIPEGTLETSVDKQIDETIDKIHEAFHDFKFKEAVDATMQLAAYGNVLFQQCEPWKTIKLDLKRCQNDLYQCLQLLKAIAILIEPVLPSIAEKIWQQLGQKGSVHDTNAENCKEALKVGADLPKPEVLFTKIPDEAVDKLATGLNQRIESARAKAN